MNPKKKKQKWFLLLFLLLLLFMFMLMFVMIYILVVEVVYLVLSCLTGLFFSSQISCFLSCLIVQLFIVQMEKLSRLCYSSSSSSSASSSCLPSPNYQSDHQESTNRYQIHKKKLYIYIYI